MKQTRDAVAILQDLFRGDLLAVYLHGSAVSGGLRPQSDIDLIAVLARPMSAAERKSLVTALLRVSGRHPAPAGGPRCLEVMVLLADDLAARTFPDRAEFLYGEWLRGAFERGDVPEPVRDAENTLVLAQARQEALPLLGPAAPLLLPEIPIGHIREAMREALPPLLASLRGDERNVLLTLARMWRTADIGDFVSKDAAATWAAERMPGPEAATLVFAREAYIGTARDDWSDRQDAVRRTAGYLQGKLATLLETA